MRKSGLLGAAGSPRTGPGANTFEMDERVVKKARSPAPAAAPALAPPATARAAPSARLHCTATDTRAPHRPRKWKKTRRRRPGAQSCWSCSRW